MTAQCTSRSLQESWPQLIAKVTLLCIGIVALLIGVAQVQAQASSTIVGTVADPSGAPIPGAIVTVTGPALQIPQLKVKTASDGTYRFNDVPVGSYQMHFEMNGFQSLNREGIILTAGFVARVDASLTVGSVTETVTVTGQSPVIDPTTTAVSDTFLASTLEDIPNTRQQYQVLAMTPGITLTGANTDVGGSQMGTQQTYKNYGTTGESSPSIEGVLFRQELDSSGYFIDYYSLQEFHIQSAAMDASQDLGGTVWSGITKSGGNTYHGSAIGAYEPGQAQLSNQDAYLISHGVTSVASKINYLYDVFGDIGGYIKKNKLWFYGAVREQKRSQFAAGFVQDSVLGPSGLQGNGVALAAVQPLWNQTGKVSYQISHNYKLIGFIQRVSKNLASEQAQAQTASPFTPFKSSDILGYAPKPMKIELQGTPSNNLVFNGQYSFLGFWNAPRRAQPGTDVAGNPTQMDASTGWLHGPYILGYSIDTQVFSQEIFNVTYLPTHNLLGKHIFEAGFFGNYNKAGTPTTGKCNGQAPYCSGNYELLFNRINNLPFQPFEIITVNTPINTYNDRTSEYSGYIKDQWQIGKRLSLNVGGRIEAWHAYVVPAVQQPGQFTAGGSYPGVDIQTWLSGAPRVGASYDLRGNGKTVLKASFGWYNWGLASENFSGLFNKDATVMTTYKWSGPCVVTTYTTCDASPATLASLTPSSPSFVTQTAPGTTILNPSLTQPRTYEITAGAERELQPNFSVRLFYVYRDESKLYMSVNPARPYSSYDVAMVKPDPGPDGVVGTSDDGPNFTLYDVNPAYNGSAFIKTQFQSTPTSNNSYFHTFEFELNKRLTRRWGLLASYSVLKNHRWLLGSDNAAVVQSPNDNNNPVDNTWENDAKFEVIYHLPFGIALSAFDQVQQGFGRQRTVLFTGLPVLSSLSVRVAPYGQVRLPTQQLLNIRLAKEFAEKRRFRFSATADVYNVFNANTATSISDVSGPNYGKVVSYLPPLIARFGGALHF